MSRKTTNQAIAVVFVIMSWAFTTPAHGELATSSPWLQLRLSQGAFADLFSRTRVYEAPIGQDILGAWVSGTGSNRVRITPRFVPSSHSFRVSLGLEAEVVSNTTSRKRAATVWSQSTTSMHGGKMIDFDGQHIHPPGFGAGLHGIGVDWFLLGKADRKGPCLEAGRAV